MKLDLTGLRTREKTNVGQFSPRTLKFSRRENPDPMKES